MITNCIIRYQGEIYKSLFVNYELLEKSLEFKGWYGDYKGVLLLSLIICIKFLKKNLKCDNMCDQFSFTILTIGCLLMPETIIMFSVFFLYLEIYSIQYNKNKWIIFYSCIGLYQLYTWLSIVKSYDLIMVKCFLDGFIDISTPEKLYITVIMIITYMVQLVLFSTTIANELVVYFLSVIAFMNGTIALSLYLIFHELFLTFDKKVITGFVLKKYNNFDNQDKDDDMFL